MGALGAVALLVMGGPATASAVAPMEVRARQARAYGAPARLDPGAALVRSDGRGAVALAATVGADQESTCVVVIACDEAASSVEWRHEDRPTACVGLELGSGGVFVRGRDPTLERDQPNGTTAHIEADGALRWVIEDEALVEAVPANQGGPGDFEGTYDQPNPVMAYSAARDRLLAFTDARFDIGFQSRPLTQAHVVDVGTGELTVNGQTFGASGAGVLDFARARRSSEDLLLALLVGEAPGAAFYTYDGRVRVERLRPLGEDWSERVLDQMEHGPGAQLTLAWHEPGQTDRVHLTAVDDQGQELWQVQRLTAIEYAGQEVSLGLVRALWVGARYTLVGHIVGGRLYLRALETSTGQQVGIVALEDIEPVAPGVRWVGPVLGPQGQLRLLGWSPGASRFVEADLEFGPGPSGPLDLGPGEEVDMGVDMRPGPGDVGAPGPPAEGGCACAGASPGAPGGALVWLGLALAAARRRSLRHR